MQVAWRIDPAISACFYAKLNTISIVSDIFITPLIGETMAFGVVGLMSFELQKNSHANNISNKIPSKYRIQNMQQSIQI